MTEGPGIILDVTPSDARFEKAFLESLGHPVLVCHGPNWGKACPILSGRCAKVDRAHGVVFQLDLDRAQHRAILKRYRALLPDDVPIWASVQPGQDKEYAALLRGIRVVIGPPTTAQLDEIAAEVDSDDAAR